MERVPAPGGVCVTCQSPLSNSGDCLACLLRVALYEAVEAVPPSAVVYGDFEIARREDGSLWQLGRGGMGVTYRAVDRVLHRNVALKVIETPDGVGGGQAVRDRFLREARAAAALKHANVAGIFQFGAMPDAGRCYYAMELVEGETLAERVRREGPLPVDSVLEIALQVTGALAAAALRHLVHRDLKPGNIMLTRSDASTVEAEVKVIDFGLAKAMAATTGETTDLTKGGFVGTPAYASPEQFNRGEVDARSDLYALGVTMWFALAGRAPFHGRTLDELRHDPSRALLPVEQLAAKKIPAPVIALLRSLLAVDPAERPASAREVMLSLEACRSQMGVRTPGSSSGLGGRGPRLVAWLVGLILVVAAGLWWGISNVATSHRTGGTLPPDDKSIAVLPFANLSADKENAFFTDGVQDEILTDLAKVADLKVISRSSVTQYRSDAPRNLREIAAQLGVANVLEGSVQRAGNRVHVTARLIDARTGTQIWGADPFDGDLSDVFAIQSKIAQAIAQQLQAKLSPGEKAAIKMPPTGNVAAYDAYLQGTKLGRDAELTHEGTEMHQAVRQLEDATTRDPQFFRAWCELCRANLSLYWYKLDHTPERLARAESALRTAQRLRPDAGEAHLAEGLYRYWGARDFAGAATEFQTAERLLPNNADAPFWLGVVLCRQGHWEESLRQHQRATVLDPRNPGTWIILAARNENMHRYTGAEEAYLRATEIDPQNRLYPFRRAACVRAAKAELEPMRLWLLSVPANSEKWHDDAALTATYVALEENDFSGAARALAGYHAPANVDNGYISPRSELEGWVALLGGDRTAAHVALQAARQSAEEIVKAQPRDAKALMVQARIEAVLGDKENAIREGRQACAMLSVAVDALDGPSVLTEMAGIYAQTGEQDQAIETLRSVVDKPAGPSYGDLRLDHRWDPLRKDPRFEELVSAVAPKPGH